MKFRKWEIDWANGKLILSGLVFGLVLEQRKPAKILVTAVLMMFGIVIVYGTVNAYRNHENLKREELRVFRQVEELSEYAKVYINVRPRLSMRLDSAPIGLSIGMRPF